MTNPFLTNETLIKFMNDVGVSVKNKKAILEKLPQMDVLERMDLFKMLQKLFIINISQQTSKVSSKV